MMMSQRGIDVIPLFMEDSQRANSVCRESDHSREEMSCGLDVEPEVAFRDGRNKKENMKKLQIAILATALAGAMSASASITYSGTALSGLDYPQQWCWTSAAGWYKAPATDSQYVPANPATGAPALAALYTANSGTDWSDDTPAVFVQGPLGTLSSFSASYHLYGAATGPSGTSPYWNLYLTDDPNSTAPIVGGGSIINGSSSVWTLAQGSTTLSALYAMIDPISGLPYGQETVAWAGIEIGNWNNGNSVIPASADFDSITVVPEPTTMIAGALLLLPFGASTLRMFRKTRTA
jgi:hypothetical protein